MGDHGGWSAARLIPVTGIGSQVEAETRAVSAVLAVMTTVRDLSIEIFAPWGASRAARATVEAYTEPQFVMSGKKLRPDGFIRVSFGRSVWQALVEVKTGSSCLDPEQLNLYWDLARREGFDAVVSISNEIAPAPGAHPTESLKARANTKVQIHHLSWTALLTTAVKVKVHHGVDDPEQAWLLGELIRYLEHPASGTMAFDDMGPSWTTVRDATRDSGLHKSDAGVRDIVMRWDQLLRYSALHLGSRIGEDVQQVFSRNQHDQKNRVAYLTDEICGNGCLDGALRIPNTAGDLGIKADLKARRLATTLTVTAPEDRGDRARCTWIVGQLSEASDDLIIEAYPKYSRLPTTVRLGDAREDRSLLLNGDQKRELARFRLIQMAEMGSSRKARQRSQGFIESVTELIEGFYATVVQNITPWVPRAPKMNDQDSANDSQPEEQTDLTPAG